RFASEYVAARIKHAGGLREGLAGYGEGAKYAASVMSRLPAEKTDGTTFVKGPVDYNVDPEKYRPNVESAIEARNLSQGVISDGAPTSGDRNMEVNIGSVTVQTSATTLPAATTDGVAAGIKQSNDMLNQLAGGLR